MPIYAYRCSNCGFQKDFLQKISDPLLDTCPECKQTTFSKMLTAAGFQLKGSGWYVTDFRDSGTGAKPATAAKDGAAAGEAKSGDSAPAAGADSAKSTDSAATPAAGAAASGSTTAATPAAAKPAPTSTPPSSSSSS